VDYGPVGEEVGVGQSRVGDAWPLTGRLEELVLINDCFCVGNRSAGVVIVGPAGVGKSRLAAEAALAAAAQGAVVRWAVATETARNIPLGAFSEWTIGLQDNPLHLVSGVIEALTAAPDGRQCVVAVDDAHLLDDLSAFVLHQLVLRHRASVIVSIRSGEPVPDAVTALWKDRLVALLELQALSCEDSTELLGRALDGPVDPRCAEAMWKFTGGNVLYLWHLVEQERAAKRLVQRGGTWEWTGTPGVSPTLVGLIETQVGSVPEAVLEVVDLVAVAEPVEADVLKRLVEPAVIEEAERRGLISVTGDRGGVVHVGHPLYGEVRRRQAGPWRVRRLRGRLARSYAEVVTETDVDAVVRLGLLWLESDLPPDAQLFLSAAQASAMRLDLRLVERMADASIRAGGKAEPALLLAQIMLYSDRADEVEELLTTLQPASLDDAQLSTMTILRAANFLWPMARPQESWDLVEAAFAESNEVVRSALQAFRAGQLAFAARPSEAILLAQKLDLAILPDVAALTAATFALVLGLGDVGRIEEANSVAAQTRERAARSREFAYIEVWLTEIHVASLAQAGDLSDASKVATDFHRDRTDGPGFTQTVSEAIVGMAAAANGRLDAARRRMVGVLTVFTAMDHSPPMHYRTAIVTAEVLAKLGDPGAAEVSADVERLRHASFEYLESDRLIAAAWVAAARGATTSALAAARSAADFARRHGQHAREVLALQTATHLGDVSTSSRLSELSETVQGPRAAAATAFAAALAANDGPALQAASVQFESFGDLFAAADVAAHAAVALRRHDKQGSALIAAARAQRLSSVCGGAVSPALREAAQPLPLTRREREVIALVATGLSNKEIADTLHLSIRSVEGHLYRASARTGASSRVELSALMHELNG
jgi:DNA-binding CsgD family transcriptional regulator